MTRAGNPSTPLALIPADIMNDLPTIFVMAPAATDGLERPAVTRGAQHNFFHSPAARPPQAPFSPCKGADRSAQVTSRRTYRNADDENDLLIMLDVADEARASEFVEVARARYKKPRAWSCLRSRLGFCLQLDPTPAVCEISWQDVS